jgi:plasmid stabilization system protein ParE
MRLVITKRGQKRIASNRKYLEDNFYLETGRRFEDNVLETVRQLPANPQLGREAFPELDRPEIRKILCNHYNYWIYYRVQKRVIEILSVRHTLMNIRTPKQLSHRSHSSAWSKLVRPVFAHPIPSCPSAASPPQA